METPIPLAVLSSAAIVPVTPQQEAIEELLSAAGGEDFFMAPPLWIDIEMGEGGDEELGEEGSDDEFGSLENPSIYGVPDIKNLKEMPTLLGETMNNDGLPKLSYLR